MAGSARHEGSVRELYQDEAVARKYIDERLGHAWWRHLHDIQVGEVNRALAQVEPDEVLEIAPGPARLAPDLRGVKRGLMIEASPQMIEVAAGRLKEHGLDSVWDIEEGNAFDLSPIERQFDLAFTFRLIRHFEAEERTRIYEQVAARLRPGGLFVFDVVNRTVRKRLDARSGEGSGLDVFDALYADRAEVAAELSPCGFELVSLTNVLNHFDVQSTLSNKLDDRFFGAVLTVIRWIDALPSANPLEWVATFRRV